MKGGIADAQQSMSLDVVQHAHESSHVVAGPPRDGSGHASHMTISNKAIRTPNGSHALNQRSSPVPASQESSESTASKQSAFTSIESIDVRQITPASSASRQDSNSPPTARHANGSQHLPAYESLPAYEPAAFSPRGPSQVVNGGSSYHVRATVGRKRSADGTIKDARASSAESSEGRSRHARTTSTASRSSQLGLGEQLKELKTRLAYAKVKVDHGWERHNIKQIETITSQPSSPVVDLQGHATFRSPLVNGLPLGMHGSPQQSAPGARPLTAPSRHLNYGQQPDSHTQYQHNHPMATDPPSRGSLAPPVDFSHPRRTQHNGHYVPSLATAGSHSTLSTSSQSSTRSPYVTTHDQHSSLRAPSQQTMEQDAIETLLFMRSPGNSATFANYSNQNHYQYSEYQKAVSGRDPGNYKPPAPNVWTTGQMQAPPQRYIKPEVDAIPVSPRRSKIEERVLAKANLHDSQGIDSALDEIRRRALVEGFHADSSDEEEAL